MKVRIRKGVAKGCISAPPSKSMAHRLLIAAAMSEGESLIRGISDCEDVRATLDCLSSLGVRSERTESDVRIYGRDFRHCVPSGTLHCRESGSTLRFMIPPAMLSDSEVSFTGAARLMERPMDVYRELFEKRNLGFSSDGKSIKVKGRLQSGEYRVAGNVSSQFISGLIFALPLVCGSSLIKITPPIESRSYIDLTLSAVKKFGIFAEWTDEYTVKIPGGQRYTPCEVTVEGDYSGAAFPDALNLFGGEVEISGLAPDTIQGDAVYSRHFKVLSEKYSEIHLGNCPDLAPILFTVAAAKHGGRFTGTKRLKIKESDRAEVMAEELRKFGAKIDVYEDSVTVHPTNLKAPSEILFGHNDHRIVMSLSILLTRFGGEIDGAEAVKKSYPEFFRDLTSLGIGVTEYDA